MGPREDKDLMSDEPGVKTQPLVDQNVFDLPALCPNVQKGPRIFETCISGRKCVTGEPPPTSPLCGRFFDQVHPSRAIDIYQVRSNLFCLNYENNSNFQVGEERCYPPSGHRPGWCFTSEVR